MKPFPIHHNHGAFIEKIAARHAKKQRRAEIGKKLLKGVAKAFRRNSDKVPSKAPSNSKYVQQKRGEKEPEIGQLTPSNGRNHSYTQRKKKETHQYSLTNQRQKAKIPYRHR